MFTRSPSASTLELFYSNKTRDVLQRVEIGYVYEGGTCKIGAIEFDLDSYGEVPAGVVDDFSNLEVPTVQMVLDMEKEEFESQE